MRHEIDHLAIEFQLPREPMMWELLRPAAEEVQAFAMESAPVEKRQHRKGRAPGTYKRSIFAKRAWTEAFDKSWTVGSTDPIANLVEYDSRHGRQQGHHTLLAAVRKAGLKVTIFPN